MRLILTLVAFLLAPTLALACAGREGAPCQVALGDYRIVLPEGVQDPPSVIWLHGWGGSADGVMKNRGMISALTERGYALIAPDGHATSPERTPNKNWTVNDGRTYTRDDIAFLAQVVADAVARHGVDRERILLSGFSRGGSMVWDVACRRPGLVRAYAPVAGAFWEPMWTGCKRPVDLFHTHGWTDRTVPLEGRPLRGGAMTQGDVWQSLFVLRETNGCANRQPETAPTAETGERWFRHWTACAGGRIDLMLHPGGHSIPKGWLAEALDWFEARLAEDCAARLAQSGDAAACG